MKKIHILLIIFLFSCSSAPEPVTTEDEGFAVDNTPATIEEINENPDSTNGNDEFSEYGRPVSETSFEPAREPYRLYRNSRYGYSALVHNRWNLSEYNNSGSGITVVSSLTSKITVKSVRPANTTLSNYYSSYKYNFREAHPYAHIFIENRDISLTGGVTGKLLVAQYLPRHDMPRNLIRTLVVVHNGTAYTISCEAPVSSFYRSEEYFNTFMKSFYSGASSEH